MRIEQCIAGASLLFHAANEETFPLPYYLSKCVIFFTLRIWSSFLIFAFNLGEIGYNFLRDMKT
jgi:hypothetical protein